jgi:REP element-mobilizing transposase RayT
MARRIRLDGAAVAHHVMVRGLDGAAIFREVDDYQDFVDRLSRLLPECGARCFAWALLSNHVHLVLQTDTGALSRVLRRLNTGYAVRFNRRQGRRGYVFMDRFRSRIVENDADLMGLIRYVHRNPLEAGLVDSLDALAAFPWSGHGALVGARGGLAFEAVERTLSLFDEDPRRARAELLAWMARAEEPAPSFAAPRELPPAVRPERRRDARGDIVALLRAACEHYALAPEQLASGLKKPRIARARAVVAYVAVVELGQRGNAVARALGVSRTTICAALDRGRRAALEDGFRLDGTPPLRSLRGESDNLTIQPPSPLKGGSGGSGRRRSGC